MKVKLNWKVKPAPTGRLRSFQYRGWPSASYPGPEEKPAAMITCEDDYRPANVREGRHRELTVHLADWSTPQSGASNGFVWRPLKQRCKTLEDAKKLARMAIEAHPSFRPLD